LSQNKLDYCTNVQYAGLMGKKERIYEYIRDEINIRGLPPTIREIGEHFDISSTNGVRYFLAKLEGEGLIKRQSRMARGIEIVRRSMGGGGKAVPIVGRVPAGDPNFSEEYVEDTILIDSSVAGGEGVFAVRVNGDSMVGAGINDGDLAIVKRNPAPRNGEIVVALIEDEVTLKVFVRKEGRVVLKPENENYSEIDLTSLGHDRVSIIGTVQAIVRKY
jgi:repressor LexA